VPGDDIVGMTSTALRPTASGPAVDDVWAQALAFRGPVLRVLGGPGTGKTRLAVEIVAERVAGGELSAENCLIIAPTRRAAASVRDQVTRALGATTREPLARTFASLAFGILRLAAIREDLPTPFLLSGAEQDAVLRELLAGHAAEPSLAPEWPERLREALGTNGFRGELRDLLMRAIEHGLDAPGLAGLGRAFERPEWIAAAAVLAEYDEVTALSRPGAFDPAWLLTAAGDALADDGDLLADLATRARLVVVDDAQEIGAAGVRLLRLLRAGGSDVILLGDPDSAVHTFRGADPTFLTDDWRDLGAGHSLVLRTGHRVPSGIAAATDRIPTLIGALAGGVQRHALPVREGGSVQVHIFRSAAQEATQIADALRRAHLIDGVPWRDLAVIVRGQGRSDVVRRVLTSSHVPVAEAESNLPLRDEDAVRPLLHLLRAAHARVGHRRAASEAALAADPDAGWRLPPDVAIDLLTSPYAGADAVTLRRLRRAVRRPALDAGVAAPADVLLATALARPGDLADVGAEGSGARGIARMLDAATRAIDHAGGRAPAEDVLWAIWQASGVADRWREAALAGGAAGVRADRDLDAVIALLGAAGDFADRLPGSSALAFVDHLSAQDVAADRIVARGADRDRVAVLTPHAAAGRTWRRVFVAGVQEGAWPDLRLRGSLLGSEDLVDALTGRERSVRAASAAIRHDEARLFHVAITRATESVQVSAVQDGDDHASPYLDILDPNGAQGRTTTEVDTPLTLVGAVAALRRTVAAPGADGEDRRERASAAITLARLAEAGVRGAHPRTWWALREVSDDRPRILDDRPVPVSPSALQGFDTCQLRWLLTTSGGEGPSIGSAALGTLIHEVIADGGDESAAHLTERLQSAWGRLGLPAGWLDRSKRGDAERMLTRAADYFAYAREQGWQPVAAEEGFSFVVERARVTGIVDRIEADAQGRVRIIDYKTGSSKPAGADLARHPQLGAYQVAVEAGAFEAGRESAGAALVQLGKAATTKVATSIQQQKPLAVDTDPGWARDQIAAAAQDMAGATFRATVGAACRVCPVTACCPARPEGGSLA